MDADRLIYELALMCITRGRYDADEAERILVKYYSITTARRYKYKYREILYNKGLLDSTGKPTWNAAEVVIKSHPNLPGLIEKLCKTIAELHEKNEELQHKLTELETVLHKLHPIDTIIDAVYRAGLNSEWATAVIALVLQEIIIKKKLDQFGISSHEREFPDLVKQLRQALEERGREIPEILISVSRSHRHIRAKIVHEGHRYLEDILIPGMVNAIVEATRALVQALINSSTRLK